MIVKINKQHIEAVKYVCAMSGLTCNFYTIESNDKIVQLEITDNGLDIAPDNAWHLGVLVERRAWEIELAKNPKAIL